MSKSNNPPNQKPPETMDDDTLALILGGCKSAKDLESNLSSLGNQPELLSQSIDAIIKSFSAAKARLINVHHHMLSSQQQDPSLQQWLRYGMATQATNVVHQQQVMMGVQQDIGGDQIQAILDGSESGKALAASTSSQRQPRRRKDDDEEKRTIRIPAPQVGNTDLPPDDNFTWRKYGQKDILGSLHPRAYYRCTHQKMYNCMAKKQVQRLDQDPYTFEITYIGHHTCHMSSTAPSIPPTLPLSLPLPLPLPLTHTTTAPSVVGRLFPMELTLGGAAGPSSSSAVQYGREVDHHYPAVADMADAMFNSGSSSSNSMEFIFPFPEDKWEAAPGDKKTSG
ncbi:hypothetical protein SLE2022_065330 [Rubroshorea leprosula]